MAGAPEAAWFFLVAWGAFQFWFATRTAPLLHALARRDGELGGTVSRARGLFSVFPGRWRATVAVHLLVLGAVTFVYYEGYGRSSTNLHFNATGVLNFTVENACPNAIASAARSGLPDIVSLLAKAVTVLASSLFLSAYLVLGAEIDAPAE